MMIRDLDFSAHLLWTVVIRLSWNISCLNKPTTYEVYCCNLLLLSADFGVSAKNTKTLQRRDSFIGTPYW